MLATQNIHQNDEIDQSLIICFWWISQKVALITIKSDLITESMGRFSGGIRGGGLGGGVNPLQKVFNPLQKVFNPTRILLPPLGSLRIIWVRSSTLTLPL